MDVIGDTRQSVLSGGHCLQLPLYEHQARAAGASLSLELQIIQ